MASVIGFGPALSRDMGRTSDRNRRPPARGPAMDRLIESEVIPRLLVAHSMVAPPFPVGSGDIEAAEIERFAPLAITLEAHELLAEVEHFVKRGVSVERVLVEVLAPAARYLGEEWKQDRIDFLDVTMGLWRLQEVLREIAARSPPIMRALDRPRSALFSAYPGEQHGFGTAIVDECFARAGWDTELLIEPCRSELIARVANRRFDLVGLTVSCDCHIAQLPHLLTALRNVSRNPDLCVMLGGRVLIENPGLAQEAGADGTAATAIGALEVAETMVATPMRFATV